MSLIMALYILLGFGKNVPLTADEQLTKANVERAYRFEQHMNGLGMGETWKHSQPQSINNDRSIERNA